MTAARLLRASSTIRIAETSMTRADDHHRHLVAAGPVVHRAGDERGAEAGEVADRVDSATPAAAAMPVRNFVGRVQKFGSAAKIDIAVRVMTAIVAAGEPANSASGMRHGAEHGGTGDVPRAQASAGGVARPEVHRDRGGQVGDRRDEPLLEQVELGARLLSGTRR